MGQLLGNQLNNYIGRDERSKADLIKKLAEDANIARSTMYDILRGRIKCVPEDRIKAFARTLEIPVGVLMPLRKRDCMGEEPDIFTDLNAEDRLG